MADIPEKLYKEQLQTINPVAVKLNQREVNAPEHADWGTVTCDRCNEKFSIGHHRMYPQEGQENRYVKAFEEILADEHRQGIPHKNGYDLGW
jgi:hypothetical protein